MSYPLNCIIMHTKICRSRANDFLEVFKLQNTNYFQEDYFDCSYICRGTKREIQNKRLTSNVIIIIL